MGVILSADNPTAIPRLVEVFNAGGVFVYPTSTLYGLGGDPARPEVSERIRSVKGISDSRPHLLLTDEWEKIAGWVEQPDDLSSRLMDAGEDLPITILFVASGEAPRHLVGETGHIAIRRTRHEFCRSMIAALGSPVISTSANKTGGSPPMIFDDVDPEIVGEADIAISGPPSLGLPSTMVGIEGHEVVIVRQGATSRSALMNRLQTISD